MKQRIIRPPAESSRLSQLQLQQAQVRPHWPYCRLTAATCTLPLLSLLSLPLSLLLRMMRHIAHHTSCSHAEAQTLID
jgi:hypothetical protein